MHLPHIWSMRMLIESCPWALFGLRFNRIFSMPCLVSMTFDKYFLVLRKMVGEISLFLIAKKHCLTKKELDNSALRLKYVMKLFPWKSGGIHGIFLLFKRGLCQNYVT